MNKKELAALRKELKIDSYKLKINEIYSTYVKKDNGVVVHQELHYFDQIDEEMRELYLKNFKKVLSGTVDKNLFKLNFENTEDENNSQKILYSIVENSDKESFIEGVNKIIEKLIEHYSYETDVVVTMIRAEYMMNKNKKDTENDEGLDDIVQAFKFTICSINKIEAPKKALRFDFRHQEFNMNFADDAVIDLSSPVSGFMFPALSQGQADVNKLLFYNYRLKELNKDFVEEVLNCSIKMDAETEKNVFTTILQTAIGEPVKPDVIQDIYERINEVGECFDEESGELPTVNIGEVKTILNNVGVGNEKELELAFDTYVGKNYDFKVQNILPNFNSKSIKIESGSANITVTPKDLNTIRQVRDKNGRKCLLIEITDDVIIDGFKLETTEEEI